MGGITKFLKIHSPYPPTPPEKVRRKIYTGERGITDRLAAGFGMRQNSSTRDAELLAQIHSVLKEDPENANYGVRRIYLALKNGWHYAGGYRRILRICRENNLMGHSFLGCFVTTIVKELSTCVTIFLLLHLHCKPKIAKKTGTLWENVSDKASCNHGFASHILYWLAKM